CVVIGAAIGSSAEFHEGKWAGTYTLHTGERLEVRYLVRSPQDQEPKRYHIKMIILDAEPEITYDLQKITLNDDQLAFTMGSEREVSECRLQKQDNKHYTGSCQSNLDPDGTMLADISMIPPQDE
ncbi:MAG: hypothetical protein O7G88_00730, partial [bacterium]|nr:hypothetical protein [bacterium]